MISIGMLNDVYGSQMISIGMSNDVLGCQIMSRDVKWCLGMLNDV